MFGRPCFILSYYDFICTEIEWRDFDFNDRGLRSISFNNSHCQHEIIRLNRAYESDSNDDYHENISGIRGKPFLPVIRNTRVMIEIWKASPYDSCGINPIETSFGWQGYHKNQIFWG